MPLLIFFWGYASVSGDREKDILKLYLTQGANWSEIIWGKSLGLFGVSIIITLPTLLLAGILLIFAQPQDLTRSTFSFVALSFSYVLYMMIMALIATWISAKSSSSKVALIKLIGFWLFFILIAHKLSQVAAQIIYPSPSKIEFDAMVEHELTQQGDSHNPDDPHFKAIKDSLLLAYDVATTKELPFNYSGFIMKEGEKLSTEIYRKHQERLIGIYEKQSKLVNGIALLNPYLAIKNISMVLSGTDFGSYQLFKKEAEDYRYNLAQTMNNLQIEHISNNTTSSADKNAVISQQYWKEFPVFQHQFLTIGEKIRAIAYTAFALILWFLLLFLSTSFMTKNLKGL